MPGTFSQIYIQLAFAVKGRENIISKSWKDELHKYIYTQEVHHHKRTFREEQLDFLEKFQVEFDEKYLFEF